LLVDRLGGFLEEHPSHHIAVVGTKFGDFTVELDSQYAHRIDDGKKDHGSVE
jgi:hypothetical protein